VINLLSLGLIFPKQIEMSVLMKETDQEKALKEILGLRDFSKATLSYQKYLSLINSYLKTIYEDRADSGKCLNVYFQSSEYRNACHNGKNIGDIKLLEPDDIEQMLYEEGQYSALIKKLKICYQMFSAVNSDPKNNNSLYELASILGILPENDKPTLFSWILQREGITTPEKEQLNEKIEKNSGPFRVVADTLARLFINHQKRVCKFT